VGCYSFIAMDSHHILLAALPAHSLALCRLFSLHDRGVYLLLWVAVLFVIFQTPLILSRLWKSSHSLDLPLKLR